MSSAIRCAVNDSVSKALRSVVVSSAIRDVLNPVMRDATVAIRTAIDFAVNSTIEKELS